MRSLVALLAGSATTALIVLAPSAAQAHSLDSSTISVHITDEGVDATISIAVETLDDALGTDYATMSEPADVSAYGDQVTGYLADHLEVTSVDRTKWAESFSDVERAMVEGIDSLSVDVVLETAGSDTSSFEIAYDAVIEAIPTHEAVVVLTTTDGDVSTAGVITSSSDTLTIPDQALVPNTWSSTGLNDGVWDMVGFGYHHVLEGADHLLFLTALLLTAPVYAVAGHWRRRTAVKPTVAALFGVVTSFTVGHSVALIASALGWVHVPTQLVEVLVALSVAVAALHAIRPMVRRGENYIAGGFGLVHGLAFAGILSDLGLTGNTSLLTLLAFNVGVELAQLAVTLLLFPALCVLACTRYYPAFRTAGGAFATAAAAGWVLERLGILTNPFAPLEDAAIAHPLVVVLSLYVAATLAWVADARSSADHTTRSVAGAARPSSHAPTPVAEDGEHERAMHSVRRRS